MGKLVSLPVSRPQPDRMRYGVGDLAMFESFTRGSFKVRYGIEAPAFDPYRRPKAWFDSSVDTRNLGRFVPYQVIQVVNGKPEVQPIYMQVEEACTVNLLPEPFPMGQKLLPQWEEPVRDLLPNERLIVGLAGVSVERTDLAAEAEVRDGKFLPEDRQVLYAIARKLQVL